MNCFYEKGLSFQCQKCGNCCQGFPGYVWLTLEECQIIADFLKIPLAQMIQSHVRKVSGKLSLKEKQPNDQCIFFDHLQCTIYPVRPKQCKIFPFWKSLLVSPEIWEEGTKHCPGVKNSSSLFTKSEIESFDP